MTSGQETEWALFLQPRRLRGNIIIWLSLDEFCTVIYSSFQWFKVESRKKVALKSHQRSPGSFKTPKKFCLKPLLGRCPDPIDGWEGTRPPTQIPPQDFAGVSKVKTQHLCYYSTVKLLSVGWAYRIALSEFGLSSAVDDKVKLYVGVKQRRNRRCTVQHATNSHPLLLTFINPLQTKYDEFA